VTVTVTKNELKLVLDKLDTVKLELLRLRAMLLPEEEANQEEKKELEKARKEITKGSKITLYDPIAVILITAGLIALLYVTLWAIIQPQ